MAAAADAAWYWADGEQRNGPVTPADLARMAAAGRLRADHLVWTDGMAEWKPAGQVGGLVKYLERGATAAAGVVPVAIVSAAVTPVGPPSAFQPLAAARMSGPSGGEIGYYAPGQGMPPRAAAVLAGHAAPLGDTGEWPLDDDHVAALMRTFKLRRKINAAVQLAVLDLLGSIVAALVFVGLFFAMPNPGGVIGGLPHAIVGAAAAFFLASAVLYGFAWRATLKSKRWGTLTMGILQSVLLAYGVLAVLVGVVATASSGGGGGNAVGALIGNAVGLVVNAVFAFVFFRGYVLIGRYLREPAWCQELAVMNVRAQRGFRLTV